MVVSDVVLDHERSQVSFTVACTSEQPITAWAIQIERTYPDGSSNTAGIIEDNYIELAHIQQKLGGGSADRGVCYAGNERDYSFPIQFASPKGAVQHVSIRIATLITADRKFRGVESYVDKIISDRQADSAAYSEWLKELRAIGNTTDVAGRMESVADRKEREWPATGRQVLFDNTHRARALHQASVLKSLVEQTRRSASLGPREALDLYTESVAEELRIANEHAHLQEVSR